MQNRIKIKSIILSLILLGLFSWFQTTEYEAAVNLRQRLELLAYDLRLSATLPENPEQDKRIVIVDIDEKSLRKEGRWPWSRAKMASLLNKMFEHGAVVVAFDIMFSEPERNSAKTVLTQLKKDMPYAKSVHKALRSRLHDFDNDAKFATSLKGKDVVLGYIFHRADIKPIGQLPQALVVENEEKILKSTVVKMQSYTASLSVLQKAAVNAGFFSLDADSDGIIRRVPLVVKYKDKLYPSLSLEAMRLYQLLDKVQVLTEGIGDSINITGVALAKDKIIPTDGEGRAIIPFRGPYQSFPYVSATDILHEDYDQSILKNTIVLVGTTAEGLFDLRAVPMQSVYPGVEVHANILSGILDNKFPVQPAWASGANLVIVLVTGLLLVFVLPFVRPYMKILFALTVVSVLLAFNILMWSQLGIVMAIAVPLVLALTISAINLAYGFLTEADSKSQLQDMFGQYVPRELVTEMTETQKTYDFEGVSREMTVLFADICKFTTISESLTAAKLKELLNRFFTPMTRIIFERRGTIDKYVGDMIMAFWGAPLVDEKHATNAVLAAFEMLQDVEKLKQEFIAEGLPPFEIGIGINTGVMNVGDMGSEYRRAYTVIGDSVNLASRLEGLTRLYDTPLVIGEKTYSQVKQTVTCQELDLVMVKGTSRPITVYAPLCRKSHTTDELWNELSLNQEALRLYRYQNWRAAKEVFETLHAIDRKPVYQVYLERIEWYRKNPPGPQWNGAFERREK